MRFYFPVCFPFGAVRNPRALLEFQQESPAAVTGTGTGAGSHGRDRQKCRNNEAALMCSRMADVRQEFARVSAG